MKRLKKVACLFSFSLIVLICILDNELRIDRQTQSSQTKVKIHDVLFEPSNSSLCMFSQSPGIIGNNECRYLRDKEPIRNHTKMCPILKERMEHPKRFYITVSDGGNLGDLISKYASLYAYSKLLHNKFYPLIPQTMYRYLKLNIFPYISMKTYNSENCDRMFDWINGTVQYKHEYSSEISPIQRHPNIPIIKGSNRFLLSKLAKRNSIKVVNDVDDFVTFHQFREDLIKSEFRLSSTLKRSANQFLHSVKKLWVTQRLLATIQQYKELATMKNYKKYKEKVLEHMSGNSGIFVSVHICRQNNANWVEKSLQGNKLSKQFIEVAMNWYRNKFNNNVIFIVASDERSWSRNIFNKSHDVFFTFERNNHDSDYNCEICRSAIRDLAILSQCNHSIITFGKFSFWSAYLKTSLEESITILPKVYNDNLQPMNILSKFIPSWKNLKDPCFDQKDIASNPSLCKQNDTMAKVNDIG